MKLTDEQKEEAYQMYLSGKYYIWEIAQKIGCSEFRINQIIRAKRKEHND